MIIIQKNRRKIIIIVLNIAYRLIDNQSGLCIQCNNRNRNNFRQSIHRNVQKSKKTKSDGRKREIKHIRIN